MPRIGPSFRYWMINTSRSSGSSALRKEALSPRMNARRSRRGANVVRDFSFVGGCLSCTHDAPPSFCHHHPIRDIHPGGRVVVVVHRQTLLLIVFKKAVSSSFALVLSAKRGWRISKDRPSSSSSGWSACRGWICCL